MKFEYRVNGDPYTLEQHPVGAQYEVAIDGKRVRVRLESFAPPRLFLEFNGRSVNARMVNEGSRTWVHLAGRTFLIERRTASGPREHSDTTRQGAGTGFVTAPMPGQVRRILVTVGDTVREGQPLLVLEAMKMEMRVPAPMAGRVTWLGIMQGESVEREQVLAKIETGELEAGAIAPRD